GMRLTAPMPGSITRVWVGVGDAVKRGEPLVTMEAMKMEHTLVAPEDSVVESIHYTEGMLVPAEAQLVTLSTVAEQAPESTS
ncbi:MAG: biotin/lipoyl-containing protein, partial [bacterium]